MGVGLITWALADRPGLLEHVLGRGVRWIWLSFGDATPHLGVVHAAGAIAVCQVQTAAEARRVAMPAPTSSSPKVTNRAATDATTTASPICCLR